MVIHNNSEVIQTLYSLAKEKIGLSRREKLFNVSSVYCTILFNLANKNKAITQKEIADMNKVSRDTVRRAVQLLLEFGLIEEKRGKCIKKGDKFYTTPSKYKATIKGELDVFRQCKGFKGDFKSLSEFFLRFGRPTKKKGRGVKLFYNCPCCENKACVDVGRADTKAYCYKCRQGYNIESVNWFDFWKDGIDKMKYTIERVFFRGIEKNLIMIL